MSETIGIWMQHDGQGWEGAMPGEPVYRHPALGLATLTPFEGQHCGWFRKVVGMNVSLDVKLVLSHPSYLFRIMA